MKRLIKPILLSFVLGALLFTEICSQTISKPNIVLILVDDLGWMQTGCYGSSFYQTPHIDRLASRGMRYTQAYASAPVCSPTRASIQTGKDPARIHLTDFIPGNNLDATRLREPNWLKYLPLREVTIAEYLRRVGYSTAYFGKWHLSKTKLPPESLPWDPVEQGYDESFVTFKPSKGLAKSWQAAEHDAHNSDTITNRALDFISRHRDEPFFLMASYNSIHDPLMEKERLIEKYMQHEDINEASNHAVIAAMIETLDRHIGRIIEQLESSKIIQNTMIIFYSDNGAKHAYADQTPLRAGKGWLYEGGIRVPLIIQWPGYIREGSISEDLVTSVDLLPTFLETAGLIFEDVEIDGLSLFPTFRGKSIERDALFWNYPHYHVGSGMKPAAAMRMGKYKLIEWYEKSVTGEAGAYELYDLQMDIGETVDVLEFNRDVFAVMKARLNKWKKDVGAQLPSMRK